MVLEGSPGSDKLPVLESVPKSTFAVVGEGDTVYRVWVKTDSKAGAVTHTHWPVQRVAVATHATVRGSPQGSLQALRSRYPGPLPSPTSCHCLHCRYR